MVLNKWNHSLPSTRLGSSSSKAQMIFPLFIQQNHFIFIIIMGNF